MNQGGAIKKEGDMEQAIVMEITLSSSDLYEDALAALAKLEEEAARLKALTAAARLSHGVVGGVGADGARHPRPASSMAGQG